MKITNRNEFMNVFHKEFGIDIESIEEKYDELIEYRSYVIQLKDGVDKWSFMELLQPFVNANSDFDESFDLWINGDSEDFEKQAISVSVNGDYSDSDGNEGMEADDKPAFEINLVGEILTVAPMDDGTFDIYRGDDLIGNIYPGIDANTRGNTWHTRDLLPIDYVKQIGELIEEHDL